MAKRVGNHAAVYNASGISLSDGDEVGLFVNGSGFMLASLGDGLAGENVNQEVLGTIFKPVSNTVYAPDVYKDAGSVTKANVKTTPGSVFSIRVTNANAALRYFQLHNKASAPAAAETALDYFLLPAGTATNPYVLELEYTFFSSSEYFSLGIGWAISTTATTFTDSATASEHNVRIAYK